MKNEDSKSKTNWKIPLLKYLPCVKKNLYSPLLYL